MGDLERLRAEADALRSVSAAPEGGGAASRLSRIAEPLARAQRAFNAVALQLIDALSERLDGAEARTEQA